MEQNEFLNQKIISSGLIQEEEIGNVKTTLELKVSSDVNEVTYGDFLNYVSNTKIKRGLKDASFYRRSVSAIISVFEEKDKDDVAIIKKKCLPSSKKVLELSE